MNNVHTQPQRGFTLFIAVIVSSLTVIIALAILGVSTTQLELAGFSRQSEVSFEAASAAAECIRFYDVSTAHGGTFDVPGDGSTQGSTAQVTCFGSTATNSNGAARSGTEQRFQWTWNTNTTCSIASVYKFYSTSGAVDMDSVGVTAYDCPSNVECTVVQARGYNAACNALSGSSVIERALFLVY
ncbi:hypothetical protein GW943_00715 [Candidatus Parcubacteria bacterium]|uniref:Type 4 fimbrial biogenesis protein PilX N-terminal domain-containing protein n=1 Tax=Candidatus Kaiserbacteria bacterium CG10_big_fil_rev_8_21_14_0_10_47_16 TaxID=1974608 RepID=A0A2H0UD89_9BACT|nr:hypothetical protein [Candidatus Parcubacteria bacterium]PIR84362.1 MAG: hypothetical protein COU16_02100 [Candidatus Kaiserbacteria bacterium CG10_big_fil_rev_8_21_14_0_10_47_16]